MLFLKVPKKDGERVRRELVRDGIISNEYPIVSEGGSILFPVTRSFGGFDSVERECERISKPSKSLKEALSGVLDEGELEHLTTSFDIIGDIAIVEIPKELETREGEIGKALLDVHRNIRTVLKKMGPMEGEFRVRKVKVIAGEDRTTTLYKESGAVMELDVAKVYFSVRLSHERTRIASLVKPNERVLALFAGVGPYALVIAKKMPSAKIVAIELNPDAVAYMEKNVARNRVRNVETVLGDARAVVMEKYRDFADRVTMPLPKGAQDFLDVAFAGVKDGGIVHFYTFAGAERPFEDARMIVERAAEKFGVGVKIESERIVRPYSPQTVQVVLDIIVRKKRGETKKAGKSKTK